MIEEAHKIGKLYALSHDNIRKLEVMAIASNKQVVVKTNIGVYPDSFKKRTYWTVRVLDKND